MPFTSDDIADINNSALEEFIDKGKVWKQNIANKPMLKAFNDGAGKFSGGNTNVAFDVSAGQGGGSLTGYTHDDEVGYYNPTGIKRVRFPWKEHHIGMTITHTQLKIDGIDIDDDNETSEMEGREANALANMLDEKNEMMGEDYVVSLDRLVHGDGSTDAKALAGIGSILFDVPGAGTTGTLGRVANTWWANRAATVANGIAGAQGAITVNTANGGALIEFLEKEYLQYCKFRNGSTKWRLFAGSDFIAGYRKELRANGSYTHTGWNGQKNADGAQGELSFKDMVIEYDPTLDALSLSKRLYWLDVGKRGIRLLYMNGQRMKKHNPSRPYNRYVMYNGLTTTCVMIAKQLNTSGIIDIA